MCIRDRCYPRYELRLGGRESKKGEIINGMEKRKEKKMHVVRLW